MNKPPHSKLVYEFGPFRLDTDGNVLKHGERLVALTPTAIKTLLVLLRDGGGGRVVSKQELIGAVWPDTFVEENSLTYNISVIRKALGDTDDAPGGQSYIGTVPKRGYRLTVPVRVWGDEPHTDDAARDEQATAATPIATTAPTTDLAPAGESLPVAGDAPASPAATRATAAGDSAGQGSVETSAVAAVAEVGEVGEIRREGRRAAGGGRGRAARVGLWLLPAALVLFVGSAFFFQQAQEARQQQQQQRSANAGGRGTAAPVGAEAEARRLYLTGRYFWNKRDDDYLPKSIALYKRALELDPTFTAPYAGLADVYAFDHYESGRWRESEELARKALRIDPSRGEAHASLGFVQMFHHRDWATAEREFRTALELSPDYATAHHWYAILLEITGRFDEAKAEIRRAAELDPTSLPINADLAEIFNTARDYKQAEEYARAALELDPNYPGAVQQLQRARAGQGVFDEGAPPGGQHLNACLEASPASPWNVRDGFRTAGCERAVREHLKASLKKYDPARDAYFLAKVYASLGENEQAFAQLENAFQYHNFFLVFIRNETAFDALRPDARFQELLRRMNLPAD
jgi:DNA-binding winged helix-turn-helix (wHTH) protein/tetratricopeptide (TPR) repeat protein